jgi:hypothetical protein
MRVEQLVRREELAADIRAVWAPASPERLEGWLARPALLRQVAALLGRVVPSGTDRIVALGHGAEILGAAVGLHTGMPFAVRGPTRIGTLREGESVAVVAALVSDLHPAAIDTIDAEKNTVPSILAAVIADRPAPTRIGNAPVCIVLPDLITGWVE